MTTAPSLTPGTVRAGSLYRGVLREGRKVIWTCPHLHHNRDMSPGIRQSARDCARAESQERRGEAPGEPHPRSARGARA